MLKHPCYRFHCNVGHLIGSWGRSVRRIDLSSVKKKKKAKKEKKRVLSNRGRSSPLEKKIFHLGDHPFSVQNFRTRTLDNQLKLLEFCLGFFKERSRVPTSDPVALQLFWNGKQERRRAKWEDYTWSHEASAQSEVHQLQQLGKFSLPFLCFPVSFVGFFFFFVFPLVYKLSWEFTIKCCLIRKKVQENRTTSGSEHIWIIGDEEILAFALKFGYSQWIWS